MVGTVPSRSRRSHGRDSGDHCAHSHDWMHMHHSDVIGGLMVEYDVLGNERHIPTVEDVLREMLDAWGELPSNATNEAIIAEYANKLKLADA